MSWPQTALILHSVDATLQTSWLHGWQALSSSSTPRALCTRHASRPVEPVEPGRRRMTSIPWEVTFTGLAK